VASRLSGRRRTIRALAFNTLQINVRNAWHNRCKCPFKCPKGREDGEVGDNKQGNDMKRPNRSVALGGSSASVTKSRHEPAAKHPERILIADDDECMRDLVSLALTGDGYAVSATADGEQAWTELHHEHYDLLLTDNDMPRLQGLKLVERMRREGMSLPVIIASGTYCGSANPTVPELQIAAVLPKPFELSELLETVQGALHLAGEPNPAAGGILSRPQASR